MNITNLNKALFYLDLAALRDHGSTVTGNPYIALALGPVVAKYKQRLVDELERAGLAVQEEEGKARPVRLLQELDEYEYLTPELLEMAARIARWAAAHEARHVSAESHFNIGWHLANEKRRETGRPHAIDMLVALDQVVDGDPWLYQDLTDGDRARVQSAIESPTTEW